MPGRGERCIVFMHCYPADLVQGDDEFLELVARHRIRFVDTGHTHYNELINDGRTMYAATRSTGQIEEGPASFSVTTVDGDVVSWKFKALDTPWPLVQVTSPSDYRLIAEPAPPIHLIRGTCLVRANVFNSKGVTSVSCRIDHGPKLVMESAAEANRTWSCDVFALDDGRHNIAVHALDTSGAAAAEDAITILVAQPGEYDPPARTTDGSDAESIGAWPEKGILGTQLGPNKNGRKW